MNIHAELKVIAQEEAKLARKRKKLESKLAKASALDAKLEEIVTNSGFKTAKSLIKALTNKYVKGAGSLIETRKRTRMSADLRDEIKADLANGISMNGAAKSRGISYQVVVKVKNGEYDHL